MVVLIRSSDGWITAKVCMVHSLCLKPLASTLTECRSLKAQLVIPQPLLKRKLQQNGSERRRTKNAPCHNPQGYRSEPRSKLSNSCQSNSCQMLPQLHGNVRFSPIQAFSLTSSLLCSQTCCRSCFDRHEIVSPSSRRKCCSLLWQHLGAYTNEAKQP